MSLACAAAKIKKVKFGVRLRIRGSVSATLAKDDDDD